MMMMMMMPEHVSRVEWIVCIKQVCFLTVHVSKISCVQKSDSRPPNVYEMIGNEVTASLV